MDDMVNLGKSDSTPNPQSLVRESPPPFLTFLHLSDIHFKHRKGSAQFDLEAHLRKPLLEDIQSKPAAGANYDGLLITGDIAFGGKKAEYEVAKQWLDQLYSGAGILPERTYVVPGNHDVNREMVVVNGAIWNNHSRLRQTTNRVERYELLQTQLTRDPACNPLAVLESYNEFAQGYNCRSEKDKLAWVEHFPIPLSDGSTLRIHGLNSAINSDADDDVGKLYLSPFQTQHFSRDASMVDLVLCHHPSHWLLDMADIDGALKSYARLTLFGHEHTHRLQQVEQTVQLFAGAVHPAARDPDWLPTYHIIQMRVQGSGKARKLIARIYSRELRALNHVFLARSSPAGGDYEERAVDLPEWVAPVKTKVATSTANAVCSSPAGMTSTMNSEKQSPQVSASALRELIVYFHRLSTPIRFKITTDLGLLRDGDDLPPSKLWDLVFQRAIEEERLSSLWQAVAKFDPGFSKRPNPFVESN